MTTDFSQLELLERAIAAASNSIVITDAADPKYPIIYCNPAFEKVTGYTKHEIIGRNCRFLQGPDTDPEALEQIRNALRQQQEIKIVLKNYRKDKTAFWNELTISPVRDANGKLTHFIGVQNDISDAYEQLHLRKITESALQASEARFQKLAANVSGMIYQFRLAADGTASFPYVSSGCRELWELEPEELHNSATPAIRMIHPDDLPSFQTSIAASADTLEAWRWEGRFILPSGQTKWIQAVSRPDRATNGDIVWDGLLLDVSDRQLAEEILRKSEAHNRALLNAIPDAMFRFSPEGIYLDCIAPQNWPLYVPKEELIGKSLLEVIPPELANFFQNAITAAMANFETQFCEYSLLINEKSKYFEARVVAIEDSECLAIIREITDRKQAEYQLKVANEQLETRVQERTAALEASQQMLRLVIDNIPHAVFWKDRNLVYLGCNQKLAGIAGLSHPSEIIGKTDWDLPWKPEESEFYRATDFQVIETNTPQYHVIESQQRADGEQRWSDTNKVPLLDANGKVVGLLGSFEDITERMELENKVRESEELFRTIFEEAPIGIDLVTLEDNKLVGVNKAFCEMLGYTEAELLSKTFIEITHPEDVGKNKLLAEAAERGEIPSYQMEKRFITTTGEIVWVNVTATIIRDGEGKGIYNLGMIENISDRKLSEAALRESEAQLRNQATQLQQAYEQLQQTQAKLVQTEKMSSLGQMIAGIAHEINNPVTFIEGNINHASDYFKHFTDVLQLYQQCYPSPAPQIAEKIEAIELDFLIEDLPKMLSSIKMGSQRIGQIVLSLRNFSRLDEADKKFADIHEGIDNTLLIVRHRLTRCGQKGGIKIVKEYGQLPKVECCAGQLNQVFMNIISNAIDALIDQPEPRIITIRTSLGTREWRLNQDGENHHLASPSSGIAECEFMTICIADNGPGMTEETRLRLFDPFFTTKPVGSGTGLGLSISYQIVVEKHEGTLKCVSAPGEGAQFWIEIPLRYRRDTGQNWTTSLNQYRDSQVQSNHRLG